MGLDIRLGSVRLISYDIQACHSHQCYLNVIFIVLLPAGIKRGFWLPPLITRCESQATARFRRGRFNSVDTWIIIPIPVHRRFPGNFIEMTGR